MKKLFSLLFFLPLFSLAQEKIISHTVAPKESYSSIGRLYNINGRELATYNKLEYEKGLSIGQVLKVPVKKDVVPAVQTPVAKVEAPIKQTPVVIKSGNAVYHTVAAKETLYGVSKKYGVTIADIKKWNNLTIDALSLGSQIIVGYGSGAKETEAVAIVKKETAPTPVEPVKEVVKTPEVIKVETPKEVKVIPTPVVVKSIGNGFNGGFFKTAFDAKGGWDASKETGAAAVFKSTSGWEDGKYYCLHNSAAQGSIVKITNNSNGKIIYAKVLDVIPDIKQNNGVIIRISNAAAAELGAGENQFDCTLSYSK